MRDTGAGWKDIYIVVFLFPLFGTHDVGGDSYKAPGRSSVNSIQF